MGATLVTSNKLSAWAAIKVSRAPIAWPRFSTSKEFVRVAGLQIADWK